METVNIEPLAVKRITAAKILDCGLTKIYHLVKAGELEEIRLGADPRVTTASIQRFVQRQIATPKA